MSFSMTIWYHQTVLYGYRLLKTDDIYKDIAEDIETRFDT